MNTLQELIASVNRLAQAIEQHNAQEEYRWWNLSVPSMSIESSIDTSNMIHFDK